MSERLRGLREELANAESFFLLYLRFGMDPMGVQLRINQIRSDIAREESLDRDKGSV